MRSDYSKSQGRRQKREQRARTGLCLRCGRKANPGRGKGRWCDVCLDQAQARMRGRRSGVGRRASSRQRLGQSDAGQLPLQLRQEAVSMVKARDVECRKYVAVAEVEDMLTGLSAMVDLAWGQPFWRLLAEEYGVSYGWIQGYATEQKQGIVAYTDAWIGSHRSV